MECQVGSFQYLWSKDKPNYFNFYGTNEGEDLPYSIKCWPKNGIHAGIQDAVCMVSMEIINKAVPGEKLLLRGHSLAGSFLFEVMVDLEKRGWDVDIDVKGPFPIYRPKKIPEVRGKITIRICGNDWVTKLFPWFRYPGDKTNIIYTGDKRVWWKVSIKDHENY